VIVEELPLSVSAVPLVAQLSCTSGRWKNGKATLSTPTEPPVPSVPLLVLPMLTVCVVASSRVLAPVTVGNAVARVIAATPLVSEPLGIMKMLDSKPDGSVAVAPSSWPLPACDNEPSLPSALALMMNWRRFPWHG
jgi:hypothetical protein